MWGVEGVTRIRCDNCAIHVPGSLVDALRALRGPVSPRNIWADAICINQSDDAEKSRQVRRMGDIYKHAKQVVVWLGEDTKDIAKQCFDLIQATNCYLDHLWKGYGDVEAIPFIDLPVPISGPATWKPVSHLLRLPWFGRVWVVQEVGVAKECVLIWGEYGMRIAQLVELIVWMQYREDLRIACDLDIGANTAVIAFGYCTYRSEGTWRISPFLQALCQTLLKARAVSCSLHNVDRGFPHRDPPLTAVGSQQATNVHLPAEPDLIIVFPMTRTTQTALIVLRQLLSSSPAKLELQIWPDLREAHDAICNKGVARADMVAKFAQLDFSACHEGWDYPPHSFEDTAARAERIRQRLRDLSCSYKNIFLVRNRGFITFLAKGEKFDVCGMATKLL
ncbi:hypothetical protein DL771_005809 [Monosporascus sp. 5C6A]|nr:hypothetical protein DL771_005809 [Monosporascus sp. 5C6A]